MESIQEPLKMQSIVRDAHGDQWIRGRTRWTCLAEVDGVRIRRVARLPWGDMVRMYGPVEILRVGKGAR